jgi:hypothetical protein
MTAALCPHRNIRKSGAGFVCSACGQALLGAPGGPAPTAAMALLEDLPKEGLIIWAVTLPLAILIFTNFHQISFIIGELGILCHEMGHWLTALFTGHPSVPTFDLTYGGGLTISQPRTWWMVAALGMIAWFIVRQWRHSTIIVGTCIAACALSLLLMCTGWDIPVRVEMGAVGQMIAAAIFLYRALTGFAVIYPGERWLYGIIGWMFMLQLISLCWGLTHDPDMLDSYLQGKGGKLDHDFVRLANDYLCCSLASVVWFNLVVTLLVPPFTVTLAMLLRRWKGTGLPHGTAGS